MGVCGSQTLTPEQQEQNKKEKLRSKQFEDMHAQKRKVQDNVNKLLLLGAGESGKSTLFKQMIMIYGTDEEKNMSDEERKTFIELIWGNIYINAQSLAEASPMHGKCETEDGKNACTYIENQMSDSVDSITRPVAEILKTFWADPGIQKCYANRSAFQLNDSTEYFFDRLDAIVTPGWIPTKDDILRTRVRTTGIVEHSFEIDSNLFRMFDVGGQRNERKKWIHCFENVTAVLFVAAISEFDQVLFEDASVCRFTEALALFDHICSSQWFQKTAIILFLNKEDLFREKIKTKNITDSACPELKQFSGDCRDFKDTSEFIHDLFLAPFENDDKSKRPIYCYTTCATNTQNVTIVFETVKDVIISISLEEAGLQ